MEKIVEERNVYLYELTGERFKEIKSVLKKYDTNKTVIVRGDNGKVLIATSEESKVFKNNYVWMEKRGKAAAAKVFKYKLDKDIAKEKEALEILEERKDILNKYFETVNKK